MPLKLCASAPGKVILNGEHSVVYGKPALAGVIGLRNTINLEATIKDAIIVDLDLMKKSWTIELKKLNEFLNEISAVYDGKQLPDEINHSEFMKMITDFIVKNENPSSELTTDSNDRFFNARCSVIYLLIGCLVSSGCRELHYGFHLSLKSGIPMGAGLGSSASFGVCLATVFYFYSMYRIHAGCIKKYNESDNVDDKIVIQKTISDWAFCSEKIMHGNPSGLDNTICTMGNLVKYYKGVKPIGVKSLFPLNVLLVNTNVNRSTAKLLDIVVDLKTTHPQLVEHIFNGMGTVVEDIIQILESYSANDEIAFNKIDRLIRINNNLLRAIGVSHPKLEEIFQISDRHGFSSKLTGAGGGGFAMILLPLEYDTMERYNSLCADLTVNKFDWNLTTIGGNGFEISEL